MLNALDSHDWKIFEMQSAENLRAIAIIRSGG
jgi:hypothetical protein